MVRAQIKGGDGGPLLRACLRAFPPPTPVKHPLSLNLAAG